MKVKTKKQKKKNPRYKFAQVHIDGCLMYIFNIDGRSTHPGKCCFLGENHKLIQKAFWEFVSKCFKQPIMIEIREVEP